MRRRGARQKKQLTTEEYTEGHDEDAPQVTFYKDGVLKEKFWGLLRFPRAEGGGPMSTLEMS